MNCPSCHSIMRPTGETRLVGNNGNKYSWHEYYDDTYVCPLCCYIQTNRRDVDCD